MGSPVGLTGAKLWTQIVDPNCGPKLWTEIWDANTASQDRLQDTAHKAQKGPIKIVFSIHFKWKTIWVHIWVHNWVHIWVHIWVHNWVHYWVHYNLGPLLDPKYLGPLMDPNYLGPLMDSNYLGPHFRPTIASTSSGSSLWPSTLCPTGPQGAHSNLTPRKPKPKMNLGSTLGARTL